MIEINAFNQNALDIEHALTCFINVDINNTNSNFCYNNCLVTVGSHGSLYKQL